MRDAMTLAWPSPALALATIPMQKYRMEPLPTLNEIEAAKALIRPHVRETPTYRWPLLEDGLGLELRVKHENHTPVGAFKLRGGLVYLDELRRREPGVGGVIAATTGNHGQSIAYAAREAGLRAVIVVPHGNNPEKNAAMRSLGAELVEHGREFQEALEFSRELAAREGLHPVPSFHPWLVRGVATYGLELFRSVADLDAVFVPIGLGSGFCGLAAAREALGLKTKLIGVVSEHAPAYERSFRQGEFIEESSTTRVAEGVACKTPNRDALEHIRVHAHDIVTVNDDEALAAMGELLRKTHNLAEGSGALAWAALKKYREEWQGQRVAVILSGGNASTALMREAMMIPS
jgi:threonine dehydratase